MVINNEITLDISKQTQFVKISLPQGDNVDRVFKINLVNGIDTYTIPATATVRFEMTRKDGSLIYNNCPVENNQAILEITPSISAVDGRFPAQFRITDSSTGGLIKSFRFHVLIHESVDIESAVVNTSEFTALQDMELRVGDIAPAIHGAETATTNANNAINLINDTVEAINNETLIIWKPYVTTYADIAATYPAPVVGWTTIVQDTGIRWRYNGVSWVNIGVEPNDKVGDLSQLPTTDKTNTVKSIAELKNTFDSQLAEIATNKVTAVEEQILTANGDGTSTFRNLTSDRYALKISSIYCTNGEHATEIISPILFGVKMSNSYKSKHPEPIGWLYHSENKLYYASGKPENIEYLCDWNTSITYNGTSTPNNYSPIITKDGDIIFVFRGYQIGNKLPVDPAARQNPIIYPASNYSNPAVLDFGASIKPTSWLGNNGIEYIDNEECIVFCEYTRPVHDKCYVWKVTKPFTTVSNWTRKREFTVSGSSEGFKHCHLVNYNPFNQRLYFTTGDDNNTSEIYESSNLGDTWLKVLGPSEKYCRTLNFIFTKNYMYWASDSGLNNSHFLFRAKRKEGDIPDFSEIEELYKFPYVPSYQATYGICLSENPSGLLIIDRCDAVNRLPFHVYFWSFETESMHIIDTLYGWAFNGFRYDALNFYQSPINNKFVMGMGDVRNYNYIVGNTVENPVNTIALEVEQISKSPKLQLLKGKDNFKSLGSLILPLSIAYTGQRMLDILPTVDGTDLSAIKTIKGEVDIKIPSIENGLHNLSTYARDVNGEVSNSVEYEINVSMAPTDIAPKQVGEWDRVTFDTYGDKIPSETRVGSKFIRVNSSTTYAHSIGEDYRFSLREYDEKHTFIKASEWLTNGTFTTSVDTAYINFTVNTVLAGTVLPTDNILLSFSGNLTSYIVGTISTSKDIVPKLASEWEVGSYDASGVKVADSTRIRTVSKIAINPSMSYVYSIDTAYRFSIREYKADNTFNKLSSWLTNGEYVPDVNTAYITFVVATVVAGTVAVELSDLPNTKLSFVEYRNYIS